MEQKTRTQNFIIRRNGKLRRMLRECFAPDLSLQVQTFNLLALGGMAAGILVALSSVLTGAGAANTAVNLAAAALALFLLFFARRTNRYRLCCLVAVISVFVVAFPVLFFSAGGYRSGTPCFFVFAITFTALMLDGRDRAVWVPAEFALYAACCLLAYYHPETVTLFAEEWEYAVDVITGVTVSGALLLLVILLYMRIYSNRQRKLETLDKLKTEFLGNVSHELKTPLTVIFGHAQTARNRLSAMPDDAETRAVKEKLEMIAVETDRLAIMVEQILDMARIDEGRMAMVFRPCMVDAAIRGAARAHFSVLNKHGNELFIHADPELGEISADAQKIEQVIVNLIDNATRHTKQGRITITVSALENGGVEVVVEDTGRGIAPERLPHIFERYNRPENPERTDTGTGLGLYICRHIVEAHGGEITAVSEPGKGTIVRFTLGCRP
jgi:signal transduction histidine kinase